MTKIHLTVFLVGCVLFCGSGFASSPNNPAVFPPETAPQRDGGPAVVFSGSTVTAEDATKGDTLYGAGVEVRGGEYAVRIETHVASATVGDDGAARLDMKKRVTVRSVWLVVDGKGGFTVSPGPGMVRRQMNLPGGGVAGADNDGQVRKLLFDRYSVYVFLVRPGTGMWSARLLDGHMNDDDHTMNGKIAGSLASLSPVAGTTSPPPDHLLPGDVIFAVDPYSLDYAVARQGR